MYPDDEYTKTTPMERKKSGITRSFTHHRSTRKYSNSFFLTKTLRYLPKHIQGLSMVLGVRVASGFVYIVVTKDDLTLPSELSNIRPYSTARVNERTLPISPRSCRESVSNSQPLSHESQSFFYVYHFHHILLLCNTFVF